MRRRRRWWHSSAPVAPAERRLPRRHALEVIALSGANPGSDVASRDRGDALTPLGTPERARD